MDNVSRAGTANPQVNPKAKLPSRLSLFVCLLTCQSGVL